MSDIKEQVYNDLINRIITQDLPPGHRIVEKDIIARYGIGKTPLREVMLLLQVDGLIKRFPRSGTIVAPIDFIELRDTAEIRLALEKLLSEVVVERVTPAEIETLEELSAKLTVYSAEGVNVDFITTESKLHSTLYQASKNIKLEKMLNEQQHFFARMWYSFERSQGDLQSQVNDWKMICEALKAKDKSRMAMVYQGHFKTFFETLKSFF